jgi:hypothetical protein
MGFATFAAAQSALPGGRHSAGVAVWSVAARVTLPRNSPAAVLATCDGLGTKSASAAMRGARPSAICTVASSAARAIVADAASIRATRPVSARCLAADVVASSGPTSGGRYGAALVRHASTSLIAPAWRSGDVLQSVICIFARVYIPCDASTAILRVL